MELIKKTGRKLDPSGEKKYSYALFFCPYCKKEVEKEISNGRRYKSCGCVHMKLVGIANTKHGYFKNEHKLRLYRIWDAMKGRCYAKNRKFYENYGGRGITICESWKNDFVKFKDWALENGYRDDLSIDRIDNDGNYEPNNCKFSTAKEQQRNTRRNRIITYKDETHCVAE